MCKNLPSHFEVRYARVVASWFSLLCWVRMWVGPHLALQRHLQREAPNPDRHTIMQQSTASPLVACVFIWTDRTRQQQQERQHVHPGART